MRANLSRNRHRTSVLPAIRPDEMFFTAGPARTTAPRVVERPARSERPSRHLTLRRHGHPSM